MTTGRSRIALIAFAFLVGAVLGLKTAVLLGFALGIEPSLEPGVGLAIASAWTFSIALAFGVFAAKARDFRGRKPGNRTDGGGDHRLDG